MRANSKNFFKVFLLSARLPDCSDLSWYFCALVADFFKYLCIRPIKAHDGMDVCVTDALAFLPDVPLKIYG